MEEPSPVHLLLLHNLKPNSIQENQQILANAIAVALELEFLEENLDERLVGDLVRVLYPLAQLDENLRAG